MTTTENTEPVDAVFVNTPPVVEDDLDNLAAPPPRRASRVSVATILLGLAAVGCIGFALGVIVEKKQVPQTQVSAAGGGARAAGGQSPTTVAGTAGAGTGGAGQRGANGAGAGGAGFGGGGGGVVGQVTAVNGNVLTVTETNGNVVKVNLDAQTTINKTSTETLADIKAGNYVTVQGATGADGTVTAVRVVDSGTTAPAAGAGLRGGAGAAGAGGATGAGGSVPGGGQGGGPGGSRPPRSTTVP